MRESPWNDRNYIEEYLLHNKKYDSVTGEEVNYLIKRFNLKKGMRVLDLGCGYGRHSIEFAKRGMRVTGVDISEEFIRMAGQKSQGLDIEWINEDVMVWKARKRFDLVINMYTSILGEVGGVERDIMFLKKIRDALDTNGHFVITTLNAYRQAWMGNEKFNPVKSEIIWRWAGKGKIYQAPVRLYTPMELFHMCKAAGLEITHVYGGDRPGDIVKEYSFNVKHIEIILFGAGYY